MRPVTTGPKFGCDSAFFRNKRLIASGTAMRNCATNVTISTGTKDRADKKSDQGDT